MNKGYYFNIILFFRKILIKYLKILYEKNKLITVLYPNCRYKILAIKNLNKIKR